jgi:uncharacterized repeat protein (TIGR03803 family)
MTDGVQRQDFVPKRRGAAAAAYGLLMVLLTLIATTGSAPAQTLTVLYSFTNSPDGAEPAASVVRDATGNLYGTTYMGGSFGPTAPGGTVFKVDKSGKETVLLSLDGVIGAPGGAFPTNPLILDATGNLYGVALEGIGGSGVIFKLSPSGKETILYNFQGGLFNEKPKDPQGGLLMDKAGNLYGTTVSGGVSPCSHHGHPDCGTVFKLAKNGKLTILYSFKGGSDGASPAGSLIMDKAGNLYGTTQAGGDLSCTFLFMPGCGVVFKLDPTGKETVLHRFRGGADGADPAGSLLMDDAGNLYGSAVYAGEFGGQCDAFGYEYGCGTLFKVDNAGKFSVLHSFSSDGAEGQNPNGGLVSDPAGNLYGTTEFGGDSLVGGTIFKVSTTGKLKVLFGLGGNDGITPAAGLIRDSAGNFYGTTYGGLGNVFKFTP